ncbi:SPFH domain-containing protein [Telmatospirillum sp.]|uniref:SPFH domain-containing protein n=1 Tax=Telmatospirillum sp. TaxID=2079197 RepID=UPI00284C3F99|nr:SPFH domain-containing protein [Telmatospirillum sp.]MDR3438573.1 SPFH domain-containing protein [Telmatospirillum sp.]
MFFFVENIGTIVLWLGIVVAALYIFLSTVRIINQFERGVVLTLGRYTSTRSPGLNILIPWIQTLRRADIRIMVAEIDPQDLITKDNVSVKVTAVVYYRISDPRKALLEVRDYPNAINQLAQITLRSTIGQYPLDKLLANQEELNETISKVIEIRTEEWGVQVDHVEIRSVDLSPSMIRAMAQEAEAERGARARVATASGEKLAAEELAEAARILSTQPAAMTLRTLATLKEIGAEQNTTIVFPISQENLMASASMAAAIKDSQRHS